MLYAFLCALLLVLPIGGCATQGVLDMKLGRRIGGEGFLPPEYVSQSADESITLHILYQDVSTPGMYCIETTVAASNMLALIEKSGRNTTNGIPMVDVVACIVAGENHWVDELPQNAVARFERSPWQGYLSWLYGTPGYEQKQNAFVIYHDLRFDGQRQQVAFEGRSHYNEDWAWWSMPTEIILLVPAACWDVLTAVVQIPFYTARDAMSVGLSLGGDPGTDNPWRRLDKPGRFFSPHLVDAPRRKILVTRPVYDDIQYRDISMENTRTAYERYVSAWPDGRHVSQARARIAEFQDREDQDRFNASMYSLSELQNFLEARPSSKYADRVRTMVDSMSRSVAVQLQSVETNAAAGGIFVNISRSDRTFVVGVTKREEVEAFMGPGSPTADGTGAVWDVAFQRGEYIPAPLYWPNGILPAKPLVLAFDSAGVLKEIHGE